MLIGRVHKKRLISIGLCCVLVLGLSACGQEKQKKEVSQEILTQKKTEDGRTQISVLVKYAFTINGFEKAVEEKFPNIDIVQIGNYTHDMGVDEYASRLKHDDLPDIVMTWPLDVGEEYWEERLIDLSGMGFTDKYELSMLNNIAKDGKLYYLPGPAQVRGIVYNKTMFAENGWQVPQNYEEFLGLCKTIEDSGIRSIQLGFKNEEVLDTAFIGYNYSQCFSSPQDVQWIDDYNSGMGSFGEHFGTALDVFQQMIDAGIWQKEDLDINYSDREKMLFTRQCAMAEDSVLLARMGYQQTGSTDEFAMMPFFNPGEEGEWARLYMVCYIGLNKHLQDKGNEGKFELVKEIMEYISTEEGQEMLSSDTGAMFSSLSGSKPPAIPEIDALIPTLTHGRYAIFTPLQNAQSALREGLAGMIRGDVTKEDVIRMVDEQNLNPEKEETPEKLGEATEIFSLIDTGGYVADVIREFADSDLGLVMDNGKDGLYNGKGISGKFYKGDVTTADVGRVLSDFKAGDKGSLCKVTMTGANLKKTLEYSISVENNQTGWFYYFSGLKMEFDPTAEQGSRIKSITLEDGKALDDKKTYSAVIMNDTVLEECIESSEQLDATITSVLQDAIKDAGTISPSKDGRFVVAGE